MFKYKVEVYWSEEDKCFIANIPELEGCKTHGETAIEAMEMAQEAIEGYVEMLEDLGDKIPVPLSVKECSGRLTLRMSSLLHRDLSSQADIEKSSLNDLIVKKLQQNSNEFVRKDDLEEIIDKCIEKSIDKVLNKYIPSHDERINRTSIEKLNKERDLFDLNTDQSSLGKLFVFQQSFDKNTFNTNYEDYDFTYLNPQTTEEKKKKRKF